VQNRTCSDTHFQHSQFHIMFLSLHTMLHSYVHLTGNAGWAGVGWGGDVNVRLKLNTPLMLRWAWGGCVLTCWKKQHRSTCTMITETGKAKKGPDFLWKGCQTQEKWHVFKKYVYFETATKHWKVCHFLTMVMRLHARFRTRRDVYPGWVRW